MRRIDEDIAELAEAWDAMHPEDEETSAKRRDPLKQRVSGQAGADLDDAVQARRTRNEVIMERRLLAPAACFACSACATILDFDGYMGANASAGGGGATTPSSSMSSSSGDMGGGASSSSITTASSSSSSSALVSSSASSSGPGGPYYPVGVQQDVPEAWVTGGGWSLCYQDTYNVEMQSQWPKISTTCAAANLLLACKKSSASTYQVLAAGPRKDVLTDTGPQNGQTHEANGVQWYFNNAWAWGFAPAGVPVWQMQCDINQGSDRLCWLFVSGAGGWRCGGDWNLNAATNWQRFVFQK